MTINCKGQLIDLSTPKVMGILNVTPDSFYDGNTYTGDTKILKQVESMLVEGATFIDIGGYSSRPNADFVNQEEEIDRVLPSIELILKHFPETLISVDTFRSTVAKRAVEAGATMINDISAGHLDSAMLETVAMLRVPYIMMHMRGTPQTMQEHTQYNDLVKDVIFYFSERLSVSRALGLIDIIVDPGFGFSKTLEQNYELLNNLDLLKMIDKPILSGLSRKSMIYKTLNGSPQTALNGTTVLNTIALQKGASILRVHDVKEAMECIKLTEKLKG